MRVNIGLVAFGVLLLFSNGCTEDFDASRKLGFRGTLGEEVFKVVCQRMASAAGRDQHALDPTSSYDVTGNETRALCEGQTDPSTAPTARLQELARQRSRMVDALDRMMPESMEDDLSNLLTRLIPFYDPPEELFPNQTRAIAAFITPFLTDRNATEALMRITAREGMRPQALKLGTVQSTLSWEGLPEFIENGLTALNKDGVAEQEWRALLEVVALEMATLTGDTPQETTTLDVARELLLAEDEAFAGLAPLYIAQRDRRGLPVPAVLTAPFVDRDADGAPDIDRAGSFVNADSHLWQLPTPYALADEAPGIRRDAHGRALSEDGSLSFRYLNIDRSLLAGLLRDLHPLLSAEADAGFSFLYGAQPLLGEPAAAEEPFAASSIAYTSKDASNAPFFDVIHAIGLMLAEPETDDTIELLQILLQDHEPLLARMAASGLFADANGDQDPHAKLPRTQELWDGMLEVLTVMAEDEVLDDFLRTLNAPKARYLGPIYAELMRHKDIPLVDPVALRTAPPLLDQVMDVPVVRTTRDGQPVREWLPGSQIPPYPSSTPNNMSLFHQTAMTVAELSQASFCNREGAYIILGEDNPLASIANPLLSLLTFGECELLELDDLAYAYAQAITGRLRLTLTNDLLQGFVDGLNGLVPGLGDSLTAPMLAATGIRGLTVTPTPYALTRLVYATPTPTTAALADPGKTRYGDVVLERFNAVPLTWEREYCFRGDELIDHGDGERYPCDGDDEVPVTFFEAISPLLNMCLDHKEAFPDRPFLFSMLTEAIARRWSSIENTMIQSHDPSAPRYQPGDNAISYEKLTADFLADCSWEQTPAGRRCNPEHAGHGFKLSAELSSVLENIEIRPGYDGIDVVAAAIRAILVPARHQGLQNRRGETTTWTNAGSRELQLTPIYMLFDALNAIDDSFSEDGDPSRHQRWLSSRSAFVDQFLLTEPSGAGGARFANPHLTPAVKILLNFVEDRLAEHRQLGDRRAWASGLAGRLEASMNSAVGSAMLDLALAFESDPNTKSQLTNFVTYLLDETPTDIGPDGHGPQRSPFASTLLDIADLLQLLEDDGNMVPLVNSASEALAMGAKQSPTTGKAPDVAEGLAQHTIRFLDALNGADEDDTLIKVMANAVKPPAGGGETPIEVLVDVIGEVNRVDPGTNPPMTAEDYELLFENTIELMTDEGRGLERIYNMIQSRALD